MVQPYEHLFMFSRIQVGLDLTSRERTGLWVTVVGVLNTDFTPEAIISTVFVVRTDAFNVCSLKSTDWFCEKHLR
jgi:hypothetical protein